nr:hypothetical protein [uncultured Undibacterium sp.]
MKKKKKIIFLIGTSFSGSTIIGASITGKSVDFLSEIDRLDTFNRHNPSHMICECTTCSLLGRAQSCPVFGKNRKKKISSKIGIVEQYLELISTCGDVVIDGSKSADWVMNLIDSGLGAHCEVYAILVARNPVAYAYSDADATGNQYWQGAIAWRETYTHALRVVMHRFIPMIVLPYERCFDTFKQEAVTRALSELCGYSLKFELAGGKSEQHMVGGNTGVYIQMNSDKKNEISLLENYDNGEEWKFDFYRNPVVTESCRWTEIGIETAQSIMSIPGVVDTMGIFGYSVGSIMNYFQVMKTN